MKKLRMSNGEVLDADAPPCPECDAEVHPRGKLGPSDYWVCENGHRFEEALEA